ncbi:hypothetical protein RJP56_11145 [Shewanella baltica]|uniref:hypothetical protein n=1 Tax=Shewanella baltica TaxID=62322 RepID=UPI002870C71A|nr:hypothetical protein [Shewanella baltica]MDR9766611.1 hypothetical protein [Shewanella baltica]
MNNFEKVLESLPEEFDEKKLMDTINKIGCSISLSAAKKQVSKRYGVIAINSWSKNRLPNKEPTRKYIGMDRSNSGY